MIGHKAASCPSSGKGFKGECYNCDLIGHSARNCPFQEKEKGKVARQEKEERDHQRAEKEESTEFGKRKEAGSGRQRNKAAEMRTEQDGRNRWKEKEEMNIAWTT